MINKNLKKRIIEISYKYGLSHLSSCLTAVDIINHIYETKKKGERFVLSQGHAGLALYVVLEKYENQNAEALWINHGTHPNRALEHGICASTGSLGHGLPIALGMAIALPNDNVYCLISDGECAEGSIWEALMIKEKLELDNLKVHVNANGYSAYDDVDILILWQRLDVFGVEGDDFWYTNTHNFPFLNGVDGHYYKMTEKDYKLALEILK